MVVTVLGMVTLLKFRQFQKAYLPITLTRSGMSIAEIPLFSKTLSPICSNPSGREMPVSFVQPEKSYQGSTFKSFGSMTEDRFSQPKNVLLSNSVTLSGMMMPVSDVQLMNAPAPKRSNVSGSEICSSVEQFENAEAPIFVTVIPSIRAGIVTFVIDPAYPLMLPVFLSNHNVPPATVYATSPGKG
jgi:hypothetical protein